MRGALGGILDAESAALGWLVLSGKGVDVRAVAEKKK